MSNSIITVGIAITPAPITLGQPCDLTLSATLSPSHPTPITIYTYPNIFNLPFAIQRENFYCLDLTSSNRPLFLQLTKGGRRKGHVKRKLGTPHAQHFLTLHPGQTIHLTTPFRPATNDQDPLVPGHRYRFGINERETLKFGAWLRGTREEVLAAPGEEESPDGWAKDRIELRLPEPIEFEVVGAESAGGEVS